LLVGYFSSSLDILVHTVRYFSTSYIYSKLDLLVLLEYLSIVVEYLSLVVEYLEPAGPGPWTQEDH
jgi:hypothetical protein